MKKYSGMLLFCAISMAMLSGIVYAGETSAAHKVELLWPDGAPDAKGNQDGDKPTLTICLADKDKATDTAVVICPGGGYGYVSMEHEGTKIADWLNSIGAAAFIVNYRQKGTGYSYPAPLQDAQRAVRIVRARAQEWNIDPKKIGIMGFSAGGHLASSIGTHFQNNYYDAKDAIDKTSCRPDFMVLLYPVITMDDSFTHRGSKINLLGRNPEQKMVEIFSNEKQVTSDTPPTFLVHSSEDKTVPVENSIYFYLALRKAGVPAEMHIYQKGSHGSGIEEKFGMISTWPERCAQWMDINGLLDKKNDQR